jgi:hypothetical protein
MSSRSGAPKAGLLANPFEASAAETKIEPTQEELSKIMESFKDPEFRKMFEAYAQEISDPKNREENIAYLRQLEAENAIPKGMKLVHPTAAFCVKTACTKPKAGEKVFVNFCSSADVDNASAEKQVGGSSWQVPYIMPPQCRFDIDKSDERVSVFDVVFGPETIRRAQASVDFQNMVIEVALDAAQKNGNIELSRDFKLLKNVTARALPIPALSIRADSSATHGKQPAAASAAAAKPAPAASTSAAPAPAPAKAKTASTVTSTRSNASTATAAAGTAATKTSSANATSASAPAPTPVPAPASVPAAAKLQAGVEVPTHSIVHRGEFDMQQFMMGRAEVAGARRPRELLVHVELPKLVCGFGSRVIDANHCGSLKHQPSMYCTQYCVCIFIRRFFLLSPVFFVNTCSPPSAASTSTCRTASCVLRRPAPTR